MNVKTYTLIKFTTIILANIIFFIIIGELVARLIVHNDWILMSTPDTSSTKWKLLWEKNHEQVTIYSIDQFDPLLGWAPLKNAKNIPMEHGNVSFNSAGIRGTREYNKEKPTGTMRIAVVGDSFSFGEGVNDNETYSATLANILPDLEVLNFAVHGYGIDQMSLRVENNVLAYHPDIVIIAFISDDLNRVLLDFRDYLKPKFVLKDNQLTLIHKPNTPPEILSSKLRFQPKIIDFFTLITDRLKNNDEQYKIYEPIVHAIWDKTIENIKKNGALPIILFLPTGEEMINTEVLPLPIELFLFSYCQTKNITCFSSRPYITKAYLQGTQLDIYEHYNAQIHRVIAEGLSEDLKQHIDEWRDR